MEPKAKEAISLLEESHEGSLATLEETKPYVSAVSFIYETASPGEKWGKVQLFLSGLARHTRNLQKNPNVSLLVTEKGSGPSYEKKRATFQGTICETKDEVQLKKFKERYVQVFPPAAMFFGFADFHFFEIDISEIHWIAGFGKIETFQ